MVSKYRNAGQTCVCTNRTLVQEGVAEEFIRKLVTAVTTCLVLGDPMVEGVTTGPLIDTRAADGVREIIDDAVTKGARVLTCGERGLSLCLTQVIQELSTACHT